MPDLLLIPTGAEQEILLPRLQVSIAAAGLQVELVGFGPIAAAARTADLIAKHQPKRVSLIGIGGTYGGWVTIGNAVCFSQVTCDGIGAGQGDTHVSSDDMGWPMIASPEIGGAIQLVDESSHDLLTVCAASGDASEAERRKKLFPNAAVEDMEGFGVAVSCKLAGVDLSIIRGVSNCVGDRDPNNWHVELALHAAADLAKRLWFGDVK